MSYFENNKNQTTNTYAMPNQANEIDVQVADSLFGPIAQNDHELVLFCQDNYTGLKAIIAVHNSTLGPGLGGIRMWPYKTDQEALTDVLRLSRGMTFKASAAGLNLGGGKAVIIGDARKIKNEAFMRRMGRFVHNLNGKYICAEDVGMTVQDMGWVREETPFVTGIPQSMGGSGDPSPVTAYGVYMGMKAAMNRVSGSDSMTGKRVIVQGVGSVGRNLVELLRKEDATVLIHDIHQASLEKVAANTGAQIIGADDVYTTPADVYAPCALGATVNPDTIPQLDVAIIAGAANNQLLDEARDGQALKDKGILYAPDFVINAGGLINISQEVAGQAYSRDRAIEMTEVIYDTTLRIFDLSQSEGLTPHAAAQQVAEKRVADLGHNRLYR
ncbi:MAG: Glu/Leu/Phe/Val dehydrogenase dimerization domain-containing protein [Bacteroidia bacterium]